MIVSASALIVRITSATDGQLDAGVGEPLGVSNREILLDRINPLTARIIGCAIEVHAVLRCGLFEATYRSALAIEFDAAGLSYEREASADAIYKGRVLGSYRIDFIVEDAVVVEVKSVERMNPVFVTQVIT